MNKYIFNRIVAITIFFVFTVNIVAYSDGQTEINTDNNTEAINNNSKKLQLIFYEISALLEKVATQKEKSKEVIQIKANIDAINQHTQVLKMLLYELQAMNEIFVANSGNNVISSNNGEIFNLIFTGNNLKGHTEMSYIVTYNSNEVEVVDLYGITPQPDLSVGIVEGTDINITSFSAGVIEFTVTKDIISDKAWSGVLTNVKFKSKKDGNIIINTKLKKAEGL